MQPNVPKCHIRHTSRTATFHNDINNSLELRLAFQSAQVRFFVKEFTFNQGRKSPGLGSFGGGQSWCIVGVGVVTPNIAEKQHFESQTDVWKRW